MLNYFLSYQIIRNLWVVLWEAETFFFFNKRQVDHRLQNMILICVLSKYQICSLP